MTVWMGIDGPLLSSSGFILIDVSQEVWPRPSSRSGRQFMRRRPDPEAPCGVGCRGSAVRVVWLAAVIRAGFSARSGVTVTNSSGGHPPAPVLGHRQCPSSRRALSERTGRRSRQPRPISRRWDFRCHRGYLGKWFHLWRTVTTRRCGSSRPARHTPVSKSSEGDLGLTQVIVGRVVSGTTHFRRISEIGILTGGSGSSGSRLTVRGTTL